MLGSELEDWMSKLLGWLMREPDGRKGEARREYFAC